MNYGEFLLPPDYPSDTRVIGVEANRRLSRWLDRSIAEHPDKDRIEIHYALASSQRSDAADFWIDPGWSGRSTAAMVPDASTGLIHDTPPALAIDDLFGPTWPPVGGLLFKVDTEGWEPEVLAGMEATLDSAAWAVGLIEFDTRHLERSGADIESFLTQLVERFRVAALDGRGALIGRVEPQDPWGSLRSLARESTGVVSVDLLLATDEPSLAQASCLLQAH